MLNKINPTYVYVALVVAVLITMLVGLLGGGALLWLAMLGATSTTTITGLFCY